MANDSCPHCGARFDVPGASGTLAAHLEAFHPVGPPAARVSVPRPSAKTASAKPAAFAEFDAIKARAKELGIPVKGKRVELEAAIAAEEARVAAATATATPPATG